MKFFFLILLIIIYLLPEEFMVLKVNILTSLLISWIFYVVMYILYSQSKKNKVNKCQDDLHVNGLSNERAVLELGYLLNGRITASMLSSSVLELIRKRALLIKISSNKKDYIFVSNKNINELLTVSEKFLLNWFLNNIGNGETVSLSLIRKDAYTNSAYFLACYNDWNALASFEGTRANFIESKSKILDHILGHVILSVICILLGIVLHLPIYLIVLGIASTIILISYINNFYYLRNEEGQNEYSYWRSFGNSIENHDASKFINSLKALEKTIVYSRLLHKNTNKLLTSMLNSNEHIFDGNEFIMYAKSGDIDSVCHKIDCLVPGALVTNLFFSKNKGSRAPLKHKENKEV